MLLVRSYRTVAPLPVKRPPGASIGGLHFCGTSLGVAPTGR
jgi:hypothetical protein